MDKKAILNDLGTLGLNLYDAAILDESGIESRVYQHCSLGHNSYSVAKVFVMTAIGLLQDAGALCVSDCISDFFPDFTGPWEQVQLRHALTHTIGFADGFTNTDEDDPAFRRAHLGQDYLPLIRDLPFAYAPGEHYAYSDTAYYLLSRVVSKVAGQHVDAFLRPRLILPLGFESIAWTTCPLGYPMGATGLYVSAADMVKLAWTYLQGGVFEGRRLFSEGWAKQAVAEGFELKPLLDTPLIGKGGMYCQKILFSPEKGFAAAWHAHAPGGSDKALVAYLAQL